MKDSSAPCANYTLFPHPENESSYQNVMLQAKQGRLRPHTPSLRSKTCVAPSERSTPTLSRASSTANRCTERPRLGHTISSPDVTRSSQGSRPSFDRSKSSSPTERTRSPGLYSEPSQRSSVATLNANPDLSRTQSTTSKTGPRRSDLHKDLPPIRSIFPEYNPGLSLRDQHYEPTRMFSTPVSEAKLNKTSESPTEDVSKSMESVPGMLEFVEPDNESLLKSTTGFVREEELSSLWDISTGRSNPSSVLRTYKLQMHQRPSLPAAKSPGRWKKAKPKSAEPMVTFCSSSARPFYTISTDPDLFEADLTTARETNVRVQRHNPSQLYANSSDPSAGCHRIGDFKLSNESDFDATNLTAALQPSLPISSSVSITTVTPHQSILSALSQASRTTAASRIAATDPHACSRAAQKLAQDAMDGAHNRYGCKLGFTRGHGKKPTYVLSHPQIGDMHLDVEGNVQLENPSSPITDAATPKGRIKLVLPSQSSHCGLSSTTSSPSSAPGSDASTFSDDRKTPSSPSNLSTASTVTANPIPSNRPGTTLLTLSLATKTLTIHPPLLHLLSSDAYIVDTAMSALSAVLVSETISPRMSALMTFLPPPTRAFTAPPASGSKLNKLFKLPSSLSPSSSSAATVPPLPAPQKTNKAEQELTVALGAAVFILGAAVEGLSALSEKAQVNVFSQGQGQGLRIGAPGMKN